MDKNINEGVVKDTVTKAGQAIGGNAQSLAINVKDSPVGKIGSVAGGIVDDVAGGIGGGMNQLSKVYDKLANNKDRILAEYNRIRNKVESFLKNESEILEKVRNNPDLEISIPFEKVKDSYKVAMTFDEKKVFDRVRFKVLRPVAEVMSKIFTPVIGIFSKSYPAKLKESDVLAVFEMIKDAEPFLSNFQSGFEEIMSDIKQLNDAIHRPNQTPKNKRVLKGAIKVHKGRISVLKAKLHILSLLEKNLSELEGKLHG